MRECFLELMLELFELLVFRLELILSCLSLFYIMFELVVVVLLYLLDALVIVPLDH